MQVVTDPGPTHPSRASAALTTTEMQKDALPTALPFATLQALGRAQSRVSVVASSISLQRLRYLRQRTLLRAKVENPVGDANSAAMAHHLEYERFQRTASRVSGYGDA